MPRASIRQEPLAASALLAYALAAAGGVMGYLPLLTLLLPIKLDLIAVVDRYDVLAACGVVGALVAGAANIVFGELGDRSVARGGGRRRWMIGGTIATFLSYVGVAAASDALTIVAAVVVFQAAINSVLAQVGALIAEEVPAAQTGTVAGLLTLGNPLAAGASVLVVALVASEAARLAIVALLMAACLLPIAFVKARATPAPRAPERARRAMHRGLVVASAARLLMQIAGSGVGLYLLFYFENVAGDRDGMPAMVARLLFVGYLVPVPLALLCGRWSDRIGRRTPFLAATALLATIGLAGMAAARPWPLAALSYVAVAGGVASFVALNTGHAMLLLPDRERRGRDLGILNLANTLPQVVAPLLAWWSATAHGVGRGLAVLAVLTLLAGLLPLVVDDDAGEPDQDTDRGMELPRTTSS